MKAFRIVFAVLVILQLAALILTAAALQAAGTGPEGSGLSQIYVIIWLVTFPLSILASVVYGALLLLKKAHVDWRLISLVILTVLPYVLLFTLGRFLRSGPNN